MPYEVHLEVYDGPFELLLQLITAQEVDLYEIRLADIVDGFLAELARLENLDLEVATEFLLIAATLVELKCRRLLPGPDLEDEEELALFEARDYLLARLVECRTFTSAAQALLELEHAAAHSIGRRYGVDERFATIEVDLLEGVTPERLAAAAARGLRARPVPQVATGHLHVDEVSVLETVEELLVVLPALGRTTFRDLAARRTTPAQIVACFLALLELFKRGLVDLDQPASFGELRIAWTGNDEEASLEGIDRYGEVEALR